MNLSAHQKLGQSDLLYGSKSPAYKKHFQATSALQSMSCF